MGHNWFGSASLATKYAIVFITLLTITLVVGFTKSIFIKRAMARLNRLADEEAAMRLATGLSEKTSDHKRNLDEGDLFGVRAIEAGYYGGIPQSRPASVDSTVANSLTTKSLPSSTFPSPQVSPKRESFQASPTRADFPAPLSPSSPGMARIQAYTPSPHAVGSAAALRQGQVPPIRSMKEFTPRSSEDMRVSIDSLRSEKSEKSRYI
ncbi:hypothetical protein BT63DRAFT_420764 [Microthyrium microscopicum]|uniref:Uncharacterized protein n=1 Tax=Microthyrium microscopicum TaxID=703497 RepID=A0A6A6UWW9_9PEZI|nr:hypothetical protein BT63DRAFT_420764 [Microthyrium microscopicum]